VKPLPLALALPIALALLAGGAADAHAYDATFSERMWLLVNPHPPQDTWTPREFHEASPEAAFGNLLKQRGVPLPDYFYTFEPGRTYWRPVMFPAFGVGSDLLTRGRTFSRDEFHLRLSFRARSGPFTAGIEGLHATHNGVRANNEGRGRSSEEINSWVGLHQTVGSTYIEAVAESTPVYAGWKDLVGINEAPRGAAIAVGGWLVLSPDYWLAGELRWSERHRPLPGRMGSVTLRLILPNVPVITVEGEYDDGWGKPGNADGKWSRLSIAAGFTMAELGIAVERLDRRSINGYFRWNVPLDGKVIQRAAAPEWVMSTKGINFPFGHTPHPAEHHTPPGTAPN
jgi:hypothetical protein